MAAMMTKMVFRTQKRHGRDAAVGEAELRGQMHSQVQLGNEKLRQKTAVAL
jgi:hypothetical protein